jgi:O-antigen/teichoic acid export membrane protein
MEELTITEERKADNPIGHRTSLKKDAAFTSLAQLAVAFTSYFQYVIIREFWPGVADFAAYSQLFRVRTYAESLVLLVLTTALPAQISALRTTKSDGSEGVYTWTGLTLAFLLMLVATGLARLFPEAAALCFFGNRDMSVWIPPFCNLLFGYSIASVVFSCLRGFFRFSQANILAICFGGITPLASPLLLHAYPLQTVVSMTGLAAGIIGLIFLGILMQAEYGRIKPRWTGAKRHWDAAKDLISYGAPRTLTVACTAVFTLMLPWVASNHQDVRLVASLNAILLILVGSTIFVSGLGLVLLPRFSALFAQGHSEEARRQLGMLVDFTLFVGGVGALGAVGLLGPFLHAWVGSKIAVFPVLLGSASLAIPMVLVLEIMRAPIDAASRAPWNAVTYCAGALFSIAIIQALLAFHFELATALSLALVGSYLLASIVSMTVAHRLYQFEVSSNKLILPLSFLGIMMAILLKEQAYLRPVVLAGAAIAACILYTGVSIWMKPPWLAEFKIKKLRRVARATS